MTDLDRRLAAANPVPDGAITPLPDAIVAAAVGALTSAPRPASAAPVPRRRRGRAAIAALAVVVAIPASAAAIELAGVHTGFFPSAGDTESAPGEEYLDTGAPGIAAVAERLTHAIPLPPGASWAPFLARWPAPEGGLMQRSGIGMMAEAFARCRWEEAWLNAHRASDGAAEAHSAAMLERAARWRFTAATDGGGVVAMHARVARAAAAGDDAPLRADHAANC